MTVDRADLARALQEGLSEALQDLPDQFQLADPADLLAAAQEAASYALAAAAGDPAAVANLAHLRVQAALLSAKMAVANAQHASAILQVLLLTAARVASLVLKV